jgi:hypothetical protein
VGTVENIDSDIIDVLARFARYILILLGAGLYWSLCFLVGQAADRKGRSRAAGFWLAVFASPLIGRLVVGLMATDRQEQARRAGMRQAVLGQAEIARGREAAFRARAEGSASSHHSAGDADAGNATRYIRAHVPPEGRAQEREISACTVGHAVTGDRQDILKSFR